MRHFESQIRLQKWQVDEAQRHLATLSRLAERLAHDLESLDDEVAREGSAAAASLEARRTYLAYLAEASERRNRLQRSMAEIEIRLGEARDALATAFGDLKKFELAAEAADLRQKAQRDRREQQRADEIGLAIHRRRHGNA